MLLAAADCTFARTLPSARDIHGDPAAPHTLVDRNANIDRLSICSAQQQEAALNRDVP